MQHARDRFGKVLVAALCSASLTAYVFIPLPALAQDVPEAAAPEAVAAPKKVVKHTRKKPTDNVSASAAMTKISFPEPNAARQVPVENLFELHPTQSVTAPAVSQPQAPASAVAPVPPLTPTAVEPTPLPPATIDRAAPARAYAAPAPVKAVAEQAPLAALPAAATAPAPAPTKTAQAPVPTGTVPTVSELSPSELPKINFAPLTMAQPAQPSALAATAAADAPKLAEPLSEGSRKIVETIPSRLDTATKALTTKGKSKPSKISRMNPSIQPLPEVAGKVESFDSTGLKIRVAKPGVDANYELGRAYNATTIGDSATAIEIYKNVLNSDAENQDALFGLASTYHRLGDIDKARPYYGTLLKLNPRHREGLNNFLILISDESPQEALVELERLEQRNPDFSPIPAQQAVLLDRMGFFNQSREKMMRAIELAPDNISYKCNLAVMLDKQGQYGDAAALYRLLIDSALKGQKIPVPVESLQKRLNYIAALGGNASPSKDYPVR